MYPTPESIDLLMRNNWHALVKPTDTILHLGDLGFFSGKEHIDWLEELPGNKLFVRGNHDKKLKPTWLKEHGFIEIEPPVYKFGNAQVVCTHYPQERLASNEANIHGHVHNNPYEGTRSHLNVSVELYHYAPVHGRWIIEKAIQCAMASWSDFGPRAIKHNQGEPRRKR